MARAFKAAGSDGTPTDVVDVYAYSPVVNKIITQTVVTASSVTYTTIGSHGFTVDDSVTIIGITTAQGLPDSTSVDITAVTANTFTCSVSTGTANTYTSLSGTVTRNAGFRYAKQAWAWDGTQFKKFWPTAGSITYFTGGPNSTVFRQLQLEWQYLYGASYKIEDVTSTTTTQITSGTSDTDYTLYPVTQKSTCIVNVVPEKTYTYRFTLTDIYGDTSVNDLIITVPSIPAPTITGTGYTYGTFASNVWPVTLSWNAVAGAESYTIYNKAGTAVYTGITTTSKVVNLAQQTSFYYTVKAVYSSKTSANSVPISGTTPSTIASGTVLYFKPTINATWQTGTTGSGDAGPKWRPSTDNLTHGNGSGFAEAARGTQTAFFTVYRDSSSRGFTNAAFANVKVAKIEMYVHRDNSTGGTAAVYSHFGLHNYSSGSAMLAAKPPVISGSHMDSTTAFKPGNEAWVPILTSFGQQLMDGVYQGVCWGNVAKNFMAQYGTSAATNLSATPYPVGTVRITVA